MIKKAFCILLLCALLISAAGCASSTAGELTADKPVIAVTIVPEKTFVEAVCGDLARVVTVVPPGNSPENYEPSPREMESLSKASLYFAIGVTAEEYILPEIGGAKVVSLQEESAKAYPDRTFESGGRDPHIWLSPKRVKVMISAIAREMSSLDMANSAAYEKNAEEYIARLNVLDKSIASALEGVKNKAIIVYHPAFGYLAEDYGLTMYALEEEGKEATAQHLQDMIDLAKREGIKVIFYQEEIDSRQSTAFAEEIGGKSVQLAPLAPDYIDNLKRMADTIAEVMQ